MSATDHGSGCAALDRLGADLGWGGFLSVKAAEPQVLGFLLKEYEGLVPFGPVVKVTGTNGKGSVATLLSAALAHDSKRVLTFTSPHMERITERIRVDGREITPGELERLVIEVEPLVRGLGRTRGPRFIPTYFQVLALAAWHAFVSARMDVAVFEAGVGGVADAVSALPDVLSVITSVSFDHQDSIGPTLADIARNKAGIAREGSVLVVGPAVPAEVHGVIVRAAAVRGLRLVWTDRDSVSVIQRDETGLDADVRVADQWVRVRLPLAGEFQRDNLATAAAALDVLVRQGLVTSPSCLAGVAAARWPGRFEVTAGDPSVLLDVAHNEEGARALAASLRELYPGVRPVAVYGAAAGKDVAMAAAHLARTAAEIHVTGGFHRALPPEQAARLFAACPTHAHASVGGAVETALERARQAGVPLLVTGSVFLVGAVRAALRDRGYALP